MSAEQYITCTKKLPLPMLVLGGLVGGREDVEHSDVGFLQISSIFVTQDESFSETIPFD